MIAFEIDKYLIKGSSPGAVAKILSDLEDSKIPLICHCYYPLKKVLCFKAPRIANDDIMKYFNGIGCVESA